VTEEPDDGVYFWIDDYLNHLFYGRPYRWKPEDLQSAQEQVIAILFGLADPLEWDD
jgi:hypothetical protein